MVGRVYSALLAVLACGLCGVGGQIAQAGSGAVMGGTMCDTMTLNTGKGFVYGNVQGYGLTTFDVTLVPDTASPAGKMVEVDHDAGTFTDVVDGGNGYLYTTSGTTIVAFDIATAPGNPSLAHTSSTDTELTGCTSLAVFSSTLFLACSNRLVIYTIAGNGAVNKLNSETDTGLLRLKVSGNYLYSVTTSQLKVYDATVTVAPTVLGTASLSSGADLDVFSGYVYVSTTAQQWGRSSSSTCLTLHRRRRLGLPRPW
eukprot:TRINITY_DN2239_c0_g1_i5.p1 TRINITY_DN2239_c0_g1~~TRINITY_DN2239_c0_g1_i5.p1  ORF type:complete len:266 (+),score=31.87 TRINITY_DN2239_c0_g1_i5:32-799(+)